MTYEITIILAAGLVTYFTRVSGHLIIAQFGTIHHRLRAALSAVPTAVLTALVAPSFVTQGPAEALAMVVAALVATRQSIIISTLAGLIALVLLRNLGL